MIAPALLGSEACRGKATGILYHLTVTLIEQQPYYQVLPSTTPYYNDLLLILSPKYFTPYCRTLFPIRNYLTRRAVAMVERRVKVFKYVHEGSGREHEWLALSETGEIGYRSQNKAGALVWSGLHGRWSNVPEHIISLRNFSWKSKPPLARLRVCPVPPWRPGALNICRHFLILVSSTF